MISYEPLLKTLKDNGISFDELNEKVNGGKMLRSSLNKCKYIPLEKIDEICNVLEVPVESVLLHKKGEQPCENKIKINWDKLCNLASSKRCPLYFLSRECHLDNSYLSQARKRNSMLPEKVVGIICRKLECNVEDLL